MEQNQQQAVTQPTYMIGDQDDIGVRVGSGGLDVPAGTQQAIIWGVVSYQDHGFDKMEGQLVNQKLVIVQFPAHKDEAGHSKIGWVYCGDSLGTKSNLHKHLSGIFGGPIGEHHPIRKENGNLDPKKLAGVNCLAAVGNVSKTEGTEKMGIMSFSPMIQGMQQFSIDPMVPIPEFVSDRQSGKHLQKNQKAPEVPVMPQNMGTPTQVQQPVIPQQPVQPVIPQQPVQPVIPQQPVQPPLQTNTQNMFQPADPNNILNNNNPQL